MDRGTHAWEDFERELCVRFGDQGLEDIVEEFTKMRQEGSVDEYQDKFEDLRIRMERVMPHLGNDNFLCGFIGGFDYFLCGFIGGLRDEIRPMVRMLKPTGLSHAFEIARFQEQLLGYAKKIPYFHKST